MMRASVLREFHSKREHGSVAKGSASHLRFETEHVYFPFAEFNFHISSLVDWVSCS